MTYDAIAENNSSIGLCFLFIANGIGADPFFEDMIIYWKDTTPYRSPTKRFLGKTPYTQIQQTLRMQNIDLRQKVFYDAVIAQEERGFMGYHASGYQFRVFQDIIRMTYEEILKLELKKDFYFFRLPGDPAVRDFLSASEFIYRYREINDNLAEQRDQLISANFTLFNNYDQKYECTPVFFEKAISFKPPNFEQKIALLFDILGMPKDKISELFQIGKVLEHPGGGTLFQFFDLSHQEPTYKNAYDFMDRLAFPSKKKGEPIFVNAAISDLFQSTYNSSFFDQYRIVVNHFEFLNPNSSISMRRYDLVDQKIVQNYETKLREEIKKIPSNPDLAAQYKEALLQYWGTVR